MDIKLRIHELNSVIVISTEKINYRNMYKGEKVYTVNRFIFAALNICDYGIFRFWWAFYFLHHNDAQYSSESDKGWILKIGPIEPNL